MSLKEDLEEKFSTDILEVLKTNKEFATAFTKEQRGILTLILGKVFEAQIFHADEDPNPHGETLAKKLFDANKRFRNHRHEVGKTYGEKPVFEEE